MQPGQLGLGLGLGLGKVSTLGVVLLPGPPGHVLLPPQDEVPEAAQRSSREVEKQILLPEHAQERSQAAPCVLLLLEEKQQRSSKDGAGDDPDGSLCAAFTRIEAAEKQKRESAERSRQQKYEREANAPGSKDRGLVSDSAISAKSLLLRCQK